MWIATVVSEPISLVLKDECTPQSPGKLGIPEFDLHLELPTSRAGTSVSGECPGGSGAVILGTNPTLGLSFLVLMERNLAKGQTGAGASLPVLISFTAF